MSHMEWAEDDIEKLVRDLSSFLAARLDALGCHRYGIDKDDLLQEIHIRVLKVCRTNGHGIRYFNAYLKKIVSSVFINEINRITREHRALEWGAAYLSPKPGSNGRHPEVEESLNAVLADSIAGLKESKQLVIRLRLEGFSFDEIARLNNWTYRKTCNTFYRGLKELKTRLAEKGVDYEN